jgi:hypothetical protein
MFYPVLGSVLGEGKVLDAALVKTLIKLKEDAEAYSCESCMRWLWEDVVARKAAPGGKAAGDEEFFDGKMRKLHHSRTVNFGDRDQAGTCAEHGFLGVMRAPTSVNRRSHFGVEIDHDGFRKLSSTKGANGNRQTLKKAFGIFPLLVVDSQQRALVLFIQGCRQFFQGLPDTWRKAPTQRFQLAKDPPKPRECMRSRLLSSREMTYMPSAFSDSVSITKFFSSSLHLRILGSERTTDLM